MRFRCRRWVLLALFCYAPSGFAALAYGSPFSPSLFASSDAKYTSHDSSVTRLLLPRNSNVYEVMRRFGLSHDLIMKLVQAAKPYKNLSRLLPKTPLVVHWQRGVVDFPTKVEVELDRLTRLVLAPSQSKQGDWRAEIDSVETQTQHLAYSGRIESSFWNSAIDAGLNGRTTIQLANIFDSLVDFAREVQRNDRWRIVVERVFVDGEPIGWGNILAAEVEVAGIVYAASFYPKQGLKHDYYTPSGSSLRRMFLKSPIRFGRVTSKFSFARFHPVLKVRRPHLGVDYGAPVGTPVRSVGMGVVEFARRNGAGGNTVKVRHSARYRTLYLHLSRFAAGVRPGTRVEMGEVIGYVGRTGRVTGPHLHFEFHIGGKVVDPLGVQFPSLDPVPSEHLDEFQVLSEKYRSYLPEWPEPLQQASRSAQTKGA